MRLFFNIMILSILLCTCQKQPGRVNGQAPDVYAAYDAYYPQKDSNEWNYKLVIENFQLGRTDTLYEQALYLRSKSRTDYYRGGKLWSYTFWERSGARLMCCIDVVLLDFNQLNCTSDSVLIYSSTNSPVKIYQSCGYKYLSSLPAYKDVKCLRTYQLNQNSDGSSLQIIQYFGYQVGLISRQEITKNTDGKVIRIESSYLEKHKLR